MKTAQTINLSLIAITTFLATTFFLQNMTLRDRIAMRENDLFECIIQKGEINNRMIHAETRHLFINE